ncbi:glycosyltransferase [Deinococcus sp. NW-56]|uniref:glycosyltransferase n=1 Tax=Deinococcus sp. NW-56 TaxID=2080419 RepID=UPI000CF54F44|nr:glycosyltransferase [Deinococcus sp. NW-56]
MAAVDIIVAPNRVCYFDLAVLESLSLGTPVVASLVGGNKYFASMECGVNLYGSLSEAIEVIESSLQNPPQRENVKQAFYAQFSLERFYANHLLLAGELLEWK